MATLDKLFAGVLRAKGFRATPGRMRLLELLEKADEPLSIRDILKRAKSDLLDQVTLYRALESFSKSGIVRRVDLNNGIARYEYGLGKHHDHLVCTGCGAVEDVEKCAVSNLEASVVKSSRRFTSIYSHNLEFFGSCKSCSK